MKTRKRDRSPSQDCEDCLPIAKRITRLNIQSASSHGAEEADSCSPIMHSNCVDQQTGPVAGPSWSQYGPSGSGVQSTANNNNMNGYMCGSHQCHGVDLESVKEHAIESYASLHQLDTSDLAGYKPDLSKGQNPHYFQINSVLYEAHLEKAYRQGLNMKK